MSNNAWSQDSTVYEAPLQKPSSFTGSKKISECNVFFSVDVSGSTHGIVLEEEVRVIAGIGEQLVKSAYADSSIGPWNDASIPLLRMADSSRLASVGGTDPCRILLDATHVAALDHADLWCLFTDGEIPEHHVSAFARQIPQSGLHGVPCIITVFGYRPERPVHANISVGISLYGVAPDCLFLFHDVETRECFIFQSKGCFDILNPRKSSGLALDRETLWSDLARIEYASLRDIAISARRKLLRNEILLQNGTSMDFEKLLSGQLSPHENDAILDNQDDLNAVILTASTRGQHDKVQHWIEEQKSGRALSDATRGDVASAAPLVKKVLYLLEHAPKKKDQISDARRELVVAHQQNWSHITDRDSERRNESDGQMQVLNNAMERIDIIRRAGNSSPICLSPVSGEIHALSSTRTPSTNLGRAPVPRTRRQMNSHLRSTAESKLSSRTSYIPGYRKHEGARQPSWITCTVCGQMTRSPALLLKGHPTDVSTDGFAPVGSQSDVSCPLALALYPETDVLSQLISCDSCAYHISEKRLTFKGESIIAACPVGVDLNDKVNLGTWIRTIDCALEKRFKQTTLPMVMLGIATRKLDDHRNSGSASSIQSLRTVLNQFCDDLTSVCRIPLHSGRLVSITQGMKDFDDQLCRHLSEPGQSLLNMDCLGDLLQHPIESFLILLRHADRHDSSSHMRCLYIRLVLHMIEQCVETEDDAQRKFLHIVNIQQQQSHGDSTPPHLPTFSMSDLAGSDLIEEMAYDVLQTCGGLWQDFLEHCMPAVNWVIPLLAKERWQADLEPLTILAQWLLDESFRSLCYSPWDYPAEMPPTTPCVGNVTFETRFW